jgi:hypothetical protein
MFHPSVSIQKRLRLIHAQHTVVPIGASSAPGKVSGLAVAESFVRANTVTMAQNFNAQVAKERLSQVLPEDLDRAIETLYAQRVIVPIKADRTVPGRNYDLTDNFMQNLRRAIDERHFGQAYTYKMMLDAAFAEGIEGGVAVDRLITEGEEGEVLAIENLVVHNRCKISASGMPTNKFGMMQDGYKTREMDRAQLSFPITIMPTASYVSGFPLEPLKDPPAPHIPKASRKGKEKASSVTANGGEIKPIPLWYDIHDNFMPMLWRKALASVLITVALRPGVGERELEDTLWPTLRAWEIRLVLDWAVEVGGMRQVTGVEATKGGYAGWSCDEWWWTLVKPTQGERNMLESGNRGEKIM